MRNGSVGEFIFILTIAAIILAGFIPNGTTLKDVAKTVKEVKQELESPDVQVTRGYEDKLKAMQNDINALEDMLSVCKAKDKVTQKTPEVFVDDQVETYDYGSGY